MIEEEATRAWVADLVRSGLLSQEELVAEAELAISTDHPALLAPETAAEWIAAARADWVSEAATWPEVTDHDRLVRAFALLEEQGIVVLQGVADHWVARDVLRDATPTPVGIAWFTPTDVWHAIGEGMLEVNLWHGTTANVAPGDALLERAVAAFEDAGLHAHFDEGRIEVAARWQLRPPADA